MDSFPNCFASDAPVTVFSRFFFHRFRLVGLQVDFFWSCDRYENRFSAFGFIVLTSLPGAKSWAKCLLAFLSAGSVGLAFFRGGRAASGAFGIGESVWVLNPGQL